MTETNKNLLISMCKEMINILEENETNIRDNIVKIARKYIGKVKYVYGGKDIEKGIDCSGFTQTIYKMAGVKEIPTTWVNSTGQRQWGVETNNPRPGDLICYNGHVAIYSGNNKIIDAGSSVKGISERSMNIMPIITIRNLIGD